jgi:hypothetical protein
VTGAHGHWDLGAFTQAADRPRPSGFTRPSFFSCSSVSLIVGSLTPGRATRTSAILKICAHAPAQTHGRGPASSPPTCRTRPAAERLLSAAADVDVGELHDDRTGHERQRPVEIHKRQQQNLLKKPPNTLTDDHFM